MTDQQKAADVSGVGSSDLLGDAHEVEEMRTLAVELRELLFDDANGVMQGAMVGSPIECIAFAKWWIQRAKGMTPDADYFAPPNAAVHRRGPE